MPESERIPIPTVANNLEEYAVSEALSGDIVSLPFQENAQIFRIGNTGAEFVVTKQGDGTEKWDLHFVPEAKGRPDEKNRIKYGLLAAFSLERFILWWNAFDASAYGVTKPSLLEGKTNATMYEFVARLLGSHITATREGDQYLCSINLEEIAQDDNVMKRLHDLSKRAQRGDLQIKRDENVW